MPRGEPTTMDDERRGDAFDVVDDWLGEGGGSVAAEVDELTPPNAPARSRLAVASIEEDGAAFDDCTTGLERGPAEDSWWFLDDDTTDTRSSSLGEAWAVQHDATLDDDTADTSSSSLGEVWDVQHDDTPSDSGSASDAAAADDAMPALYDDGLPASSNPNWFADAQQQPCSAEDLESEIQRLKQVGAAAKMRAESGEVTENHNSDILLVAQALDIGALQVEMRPHVVEPSHIYRLYAETGGRRRGIKRTERTEDRIDKWINSGGKRGVVKRKVEADQRPKSLRHQDVVITRRRGKIVSTQAKLRYVQFVIGIGPLPSASSAESISIWQVLPYEEPNTSHTKPSFSDEPAFLNPAANMIGDRPAVATASHIDTSVRVQRYTGGFTAVQIPANVESIDLGIDSLHKTIRNQRYRLESTSPEREHKTKRCNKSTGAATIVSMALVVLTVYGVHRSLRPAIRSSFFTKTPPDRPGIPPLIPPLMQWERRSNGPACRDLKACSSGDTANLNNLFGVSTWLPDSLNPIPLLDPSFDAPKYDGVAEWHLPNGFASWRNSTHAFVFGGQQSSFPLDMREPIDNAPECNENEGVMRVSNELWTTELDLPDTNQSGNTNQSGIDHTWTHIGGGPSFAAESSCHKMVDIWSASEPAPWDAMFWNSLAQTTKSLKLYGGTGVTNRAHVDWPRARAAAQSWTSGQDEHAEGLVFSGWYTSPCGFRDDQQNRKSVAMLPADLWKFDAASQRWDILGGAHTNCRRPLCLSQGDCGPRFHDVEAHSLVDLGESGDGVSFSQIRKEGSVQGSWVRQPTQYDRQDCLTLRPAVRSTPWPLGRWSAQTWSMSQRMYLFSGRMHMQDDGETCTKAGLPTDFLLNDLWSLRRVVTPMRRTATKPTALADEWAWEQEAKCVGHQRSVSEAPGPRMGGATWVTGLRVSVETGMVDTAWIFGGVGFRRTAAVDDFDKCLLKPLGATPGNTATGLCDLWSFNGSTWKKHTDCVEESSAAARYVGPRGSFHGTSWSDVIRRLILMPGVVDCSNGGCLPELNDKGPAFACSNGVEHRGSPQSGPLTGAATCSSEIWAFTPAAESWELVARSGPAQRCGAAPFKLRAPLTANAGERYEFIGGWVSTGMNTSACAGGGRYLVPTPGDFASANFSYVIQEPRVAKEH